MKINKIPISFAIFLLLVPWVIEIDSWVRSGFSFASDEGLYTMIRIVTFGVAVYCACILNSEKRVWLMWLMVLIAIIFNPFIQLHFDRDVWKIIDILTVGLFVHIMIDLGQMMARIKKIFIQHYKIILLMLLVGGGIVCAGYFIRLKSIDVRSSTTLEGANIVIKANGKIKIVSNYVDGKLEGIQRIFYLDNLVESREFQNNVAVGEWKKFYLNGNLYVTTYYQKGQYIGGKRYDNSGKILYDSEVESSIPLTIIFHRDSFYAENGIAYQDVNGVVRWFEPYDEIFIE